MAETISVGRTRLVRKWLALSVLGATVAVLGACEGDNLFGGNSTDQQPRAFVLGPEFVQASDTFQVRVDAFAPFGVARVDISLRGAVTADSSFRGDNVAPSASPVFTFKAPAFLADSLIIVTARVTDRFGNASPLRVDTINAFGAPGLVSVIKPDSVRAGQTATLRVRLVGSRRITAINLQVRGAMVLDSVIPVVPPRFDITQDIVLRLPATVSDTLLRVSISARDEAGVESAPSLVNVAVSVELPAVTLTVPGTAVAGGTLDLTARALSTRGVASIRLELRGAITRDTTVVISPARTDVTQSITLRIPPDVQDSLLTLRGFAIDTRGSAGPTQTVVVVIPTGTPEILSFTASTAPRAGQRFDVRVVARGSRPLTRIDVKFRGAVNADQSIAVSPPRTDVTQDAFVDIPLIVQDTQITVLATATDASGSVSNIATLRFSVADITEPTVTLNVSPASAPSGSTVSIRVSATENVALTSIGYEVRNAAGTVIGTATVAASGVSGSATFSFTIPGGTPAGPLSVIGFATDGSGRRGTATTTLTVT